MSLFITAELPPIQWTEQDKVPIAWQRPVYPLIFAPSENNASLSSPLDTISVFIPFDSATSLPFAELELTLSVHQKNPSSKLDNGSLFDFVSPHFVFAEHRLIYDNYEYITEEQSTRGHGLDQTNAAELIRRLFSAQHEDDIAPEMCHFFKGKTRIIAKRDKTASDGVNFGVGAIPHHVPSPSHQKKADIDSIEQSSPATFSICSHGRLVSRLSLSFTCQFFPYCPHNIQW